MQNLIVTKLVLAEAATIAEKIIDLGHFNPQNIRVAVVQHCNRTGLLNDDDTIEATLVLVDQQVIKESLKFSLGNRQPAALIALFHLVKNQLIASGNSRQTNNSNNGKDTAMYTLTVISYDGTEETSFEYDNLEDAKKFARQVTYEDYATVTVREDGDWKLFPDFECFRHGISFAAFENGSPVDFFVTGSPVTERRDSIFHY